jgi:hypothetical protein
VTRAASTPLISSESEAESLAREGSGYISATANSKAKRDLLTATPACPAVLRVATPSPAE